MSTDRSPHDAGSERPDPRTAEEWIAHISLFVDQQKELRRRDSLSPEAIGALDGAGRLIFQRQATIEGICRLMRQRPRADCTVAVYLVMVAYCDNNTGRTTISNTRLAKLLARHEDSIRSAITTLEDVGLIGSETPSGKPKQYWPISHRALANRMGSITWFLDALAPATRPGRRFGWASSEHSNIVALATRAPEQRGRSLHGGVINKGEGLYAVKGGESKPTESSIEFSPTSQPTLGAHENGLCNLNNWGLAASYYECWRGYANEFGLKLGAKRNQLPYECGETDPRLEGVVRAAAAATDKDKTPRFTQETIRAAIPRMLEGIAAKIADERRDAGPSKGIGLAPMVKVARSMLLQECEKIQRETTAADKPLSTPRSSPAHRQRHGRSGIDAMGDELIQEAMEDHE